MFSFLICLAILVASYFTCGKFVEKNFGPDGRTTPAVELAGVFFAIFFTKYKKCRFHPTA